MDDEMVLMGVGLIVLGFVLGWFFCLGGLLSLAGLGLVLFGLFGTRKRRSQRPTIPSYRSAVAYCPNCGLQRYQESVQCPRCGTKFKQGS